MSGASNSPQSYMSIVPSFGTDGVRGVAISEITPEYVLALGRAVGLVLGSPRLVIARDPRVSGPILEAAFSAGAASLGVRVEQLGVGSCIDCATRKCSWCGDHCVAQQVLR